jgi:hypothetical protein
MKLSSLKELLAPLSKVGHASKVVTIEGQNITLRTLTSKEEADVQRVISNLREEDELSTLEFVDIFRRESLSRSIIEINGVSLSDPFIETGDVLESGVAVKVKREEALGEILGGFSRVVMTTLFQELAALSEKAESTLTKQLEQGTLNLEEEKKNLESRVQTLNNQLEQTKVSNANSEIRNLSFTNAMKEMG